MKRQKTHFRVEHTIVIVSIGVTILLTILYLTQSTIRNVSLKSVPTPVQSAVTVAMSMTPQISQTIHSTCHINGVLPDPFCTPGAVNPAVTQANIQQTICVQGYTSIIRPPVSYTNPLKIQQIAAYGYADTNIHDYEEDHLISLELGGAPADPKNLWPEPGASPNAKDSIENLCHKKVCNGEITLALAQQQIASNWQTACQ